MAKRPKKKVLNWLQSAVGRVREFAYTEPPPPAVERPRIGVALGGGFARGIAHLGVLRVLEEEAKTQDAAVAAANRSLEQSANRYKGGLDTYLTVITAQSAVLANERTAVSLLTRRMTSSVLLIKALGGGWRS